MTNWIDQLLDATDEAESPKSFIYWAGMAALAAVTKRRVYLDKHLYKLYPNIYVMLVARSGMRKNFPINVTKALVKNVGNTRVISGRNSIQALVSELSKSYSNNGGPPTVGAHGLLAAPELSAFLVSDDAATSILTDLYDTHSNDEWKNSLKGSGVEKLENVYLTMITATNEDQFKEAIPIHAYAGGFIGRTLIIKEEKRHRKNSLVDKPDKIYDPKTLSLYLKEVAKLEGGFVWSDDAKARFKNWYDQFEIEDLNDKTGTAERIHDQILKVAMLQALAREPKLLLLEEDITNAMEKCLSLFGNAQQVTSGSGKSEFADQTKTVMEELVRAPEFQMDRKTLLSRHWGDFNATDLDSIIDTLEQAGAIKVTPSMKGPVYKLDPSIIEKYQKFQERLT